MIAAVYQDEIAGEWKCRRHSRARKQSDCRECQAGKAGAFDCSRCAASDYEWARLGRCTGPIPNDGAAFVPIKVRDPKTGLLKQQGHYPVTFDTCPMALLRGDLQSDQGRLPVLVGRAVAAELDRRYPDLPARLDARIQDWRRADFEKMKAQHEADMEAMRV